MQEVCREALGLWEVPLQAPPLFCGLILISMHHFNTCDKGLAQCDWNMQVCLSEA